MRSSGNFVSTRDSSVPVLSLLNWTELNWTLLENSSHEAKERWKQDTIRCPSLYSVDGCLVRLSDGSLLVVYNISALAASSDKRILRADIRYCRQQSSPNTSSAGIDNGTTTSAILLELTSRRFRQLGKHLLLTSPSPGWFSVDVTSSLRRLSRRRRRLRLSTRRHPSMLALTFGGSDQNEGQGPLATRRRRTAAELRLLSSPTLVIFSQRTADIAVDHVLPRVPKYRPPLSTWRSLAQRRRHGQARDLQSNLPCRRCIASQSALFIC